MSIATSPPPDISSTFSSFLVYTGREKAGKLEGEGYVQGQGNEAVSIIIVLLKYICHPLQADTALHEQIKANGTLPALIKCLEQYPHKLRAQPVAKSDERIGVLIEADIAASVGVKPVEQRSPRCQEPPQSTEFLEADRAAAIGVEHADHHPDRLRVERGPVAIN